MSVHQFIWTDLSTYDVNKSLEFYIKLFDWTVIDYNGYKVAHIQENAIIGVYETPQYFQKIKMPHFWMNYVKVTNSEQICTRARQLGGLVEIEKQPFYDGFMSLIRDTTGAGFSIYEGEELSCDPTYIHGQVVKRELHTSDFQKSIAFYQSLFGWKTKKISNKYGLFQDSDGMILGSALQVSNHIKSKYEYWVTVFYVEDLQKTKNLAIKYGGNVISDEGFRIMLTDDQNEAFFYIEN